MEASTIEEVDQGLYVDTETGEVHDTSWVRPPRPARCSWRLGETVPVHCDGGSAHFSGTERCSSLWACPVCSSVIRAERAREITRAVDAHHAAGGSVLFVTLTIRHRKRDPLAQSLAAVIDSWRRLMQGRAWVGGRSREGMRDRYGVVGYVRSTEVTYGRSGWHPHIHALIFTEQSLSDTALRAFGDEMHARWAGYVEKVTGQTPTRQHGTDVQRVDPEGQVVGQYLAKMQDEGKWSAAAELARTDVKRGRGDGSIVPFDLLDSEQEMPAAQRRRLWAEYVEGTRGRKAITWSKGLKSRYDVTERTDEEIIEDTDAAAVRFLAEGAGYDALRRRDASLLAHVLDLAEIGAWEAVAALLPGRRVEPPERDDGEPPTTR